MKKKKKHLVLFAMQWIFKVYFRNEPCFLCMVQTRRTFPNQWRDFNICHEDDKHNNPLEFNKEFTPHRHGNGWRLQNFHQLLHLPVDIYMFSSQQNYDNSPTEHGLIENAKHPVDHAQKSYLLLVSCVQTNCLRQHW